MDEDGEAEDGRLEIRNAYMWSLFLVLQSGTLVKPFNQLPPTNELPPVTDTMPPQLIEEMLTLASQNFPSMDRLTSDTDIMKDRKGTQSNSVPPYRFLDHQPQPANGMLCYFFVFSKRS